MVSERLEVYQGLYKETPRQKKKRTLLTTKLLIETNKRTNEQAKVLYELTKKYNFGELKGERRLEMKGKDVEKK